MLKSCVKSYGYNRNGAFAIFFSISALCILMAVAVAIEFSSLASQKQKTQNFADAAALSAANYMRQNIENITSEASFTHYAKEAQALAEQMISEYLNNENFMSNKLTLDITEDQAHVTIRIDQKPRLMSMFGRSKLSHQVTASANMATYYVKDVDIVLISDSTGSMEAILKGIQDNMKEFATDLQRELDKHDIKLGKIRVKFLFYRDYMADNHKDWTGRRMALLPEMRNSGPMYESDFFQLPEEKIKLDQYADHFLPRGGGGFAESGFEAIWHAIESPEWGSSEKTLRTIVLWTDAWPRPIGDYEETALKPTDEGYFSNAYWADVLGSVFAAKTYEQRKSYMVDNFYPVNMPTSRGQLKAEFERFHAENAFDKPNIKTMTINIVQSCWLLDPCGEWENVKSWEGVDVILDGAITSDETYAKILQQVSETVLSQVSARDLAITH